MPARKRTRSRRGSRASRKGSRRVSSKGSRRVSRKGSRKSKGSKKVSKRRSRSRSRSQKGKGWFDRYNVVAISDTLTMKVSDDFHTAVGQLDSFLKTMKVFPVGSRPFEAFFKIVYAIRKNFKSQSTSICNYNEQEEVIMELDFLLRRRYILIKKKLDVSIFQMMSYLAPLKATTCYRKKAPAVKKPKPRPGAYGAPRPGAYGAPPRRY